MNKTDLIQAVADKTDLSKADVGRVIDGTLDAITEALAADDKVALVGFGTFVVRERAARSGRNPKTGEELTIAASKMPAFKVGKALKDAVK